MWHWKKSALSNLGSPNNIRCEAASAPHTTKRRPATTRVQTISIFMQKATKRHQRLRHVEATGHNIHLILEEFGSHVRRIRRGF